MKNGHEAVVYELVCPETGNVRYIGFSTNPEERFKAHGKPGSSASGWVRGIRDRGLEPSMRIVYRGTSKECREVENRMLRERKDDELLLNNFPQHSGSIVTYVSLPDDDRKWIEEYAWQNRQSMSSVIAEAVAKYRKAKERKR